MKYTNIRLHRISAVLLVLLTLLLPFAPMASGETENPLYQIVNCEEWISLRAEASSSSKRLEKIPLWGIVIGMGETKNGFTKVKYHDVGYVQTKYLQPQCASLVQVDNTEKVPVYGSDGSVLDTIMYWDSVYYLGEYQNNFLAVSWENSSGRVGYVAIDAVMSSKHTKDEFCLMCWMSIPTLRCMYCRSTRLIKSVKSRPIPSWPCMAQLETACLMSTMAASMAMCSVNI